MQSDVQDVPEDAIAVVGMWGRFPGAATLEEYWRLLSAGESAIAMSSREELLAEGVSPALLEDPDFVPAKGGLADAALFAHRHFGYSPREAADMDPQQRQFLECCWAALEDAGYNPRAVDGLVGVYGGSRMSTYGYAVFASRPDLMAVNDVSFLAANDKDNLTTRVSHKLGFRGPSVNVQSACSTSLTAVAMAVTALLDHEIDMALAGGVKISLPLKSGYLYSPEGILSPDGVCRAFDAEAAGTVFSDGVGVVVLKRLSDALRDRDAIRAVIRGAAVNNDGAERASYAAPSVRGQAEVIATAIAVSGLPAESITYLECHGTGTRLGDAVELEAARRAFASRTSKRDFCAIGSVKPNIGHLSQAAGVASLIKVILALQHRQLPPTINVEDENPDLRLKGSPFYLNRRLTPWVAADGVLRAGVSSFGMGGTNVHLIVEQAPEPRHAAVPSDAQPTLLPVSGESADALSRTSRAIEARTADVSAATLRDAGHTLASGRALLPHRQALLVDADACFALAGNGPVPGGATKTAFVFPGHGAEMAGAGADLYRSDSDFQAQIDAVLPTLSEAFGEDARSLLFPTTPDGLEGLAERLKQPRYAQPITLALECALARALMAKGFSPQMVAGHSLGEIAAACIAGVFSFPDAVKLAAMRGQLVGRTPAGGMIVLLQSAQAIENAYGGAIDIAVVNGPANCVVSAAQATIEDLEAALLRADTAHIRVEGRVAYHSRLLDPVLDEFRAVVESIPRSPPRLPILSGASGEALSDALATSADYWVDHLRSVVRFDRVLETLDAPGTLTVEVGFRSTLGAHFRSRPQMRAMRATFPHGETRAAQTLIGQAWSAGADVDWDRYFDGPARRKLHLPPSDFDRATCWAIAPMAASPIAAAQMPASQTLAPQTVESQAGASQAGAPPAEARGARPRLHRGAWRPQPLAPPDPTPSGPASVEGITLVLADRRADLEQIMAKVAPDAVWASRNPSDLWAIDGHPDATVSLPQLLERVRDRHGCPGAIVWAADIHPGGSAALDSERLAQAAVSRFQAFRDLLGALEGQERVQLTVLTRGGQHLPDDPKPGLLDPSTTLQGAIGAVALEYENVACRCCDLPLSENGEMAQRDGDVLAVLLATEPNGETVAIRGGQAWSMTHTPVADDPSGARFQADGCWLITGGAGGIGAALAQSVARAGASQVILVGRTVCPPPEAWDDTLAAPDAPANVVDAINALRRLSALGVTARYETCDIADANQTRALAGRCPPIRGIVHAAGVPSAGLLARRQPEDIAAVMQPKVAGTINLLAAFGGRGLQNVVLCSSMNAIQPRFGQLDYCAANAFLDAMAAASPHIRMLSINWDVWGSVGMALKLQRDTALDQWRAETIADGISVEEGQAAFLTGLASPYANIAFTARPMAEPAAAFANEERDRMMAALRALSQSKPTRERTAAAASSDEPQGAIETQIAQIWAELLGEESIGRRASFFDLGGHSLVAVSILSRLRKRFNVRISLREFLDKPTVADTAAALQAALAASPASSIPKAAQRIALVAQDAPLATAGAKAP